RGTSPTYKFSPQIRGLIADEPQSRLRSHDKSGLLALASKGSLFSIGTSFNLFFVFFVSSWLQPSSPIRPFVSSWLQPSSPLRLFISSWLLFDRIFLYQSPCDNQPLQFIGSAADDQQRRVAVITFNVQIFRVARAAVDSHGMQGHFLRGFCGEELRH